MTNLDYIDSYFKGELPVEEIAGFEQKISDDAIFAEEVAFYCSSMHVVKEQLTEERKQRFRDIYHELKRGTNKGKIIGFRKWWPYLATAAVLAAVIIGRQLYFRPLSPQVLAETFISQNLTEMNVEMSGKTDSLSTAKQFFNDKKLKEAQLIFEKLAHSDSVSDEVYKDAGIVCLRVGEYDKAISYFTALENLSIYANPGKFYHALTLLKRNRPGDKEMSKQLLKEVSEQKLGEKETAEKWIQDF